MSFSGTEAISAPFTYELDLLSLEEDVDSAGIAARPPKRPSADRSRRAARWRLAAFELESRVR